MGDLPNVLRILRGNTPVSEIVRVLEVPASTYYGWERRPGTPGYRRIGAGDLARLLDHYGIEDDDPRWGAAWRALADAPPSTQGAA